MWYTSVYSGGEYSSGVGSASALDAKKIVPLVRQLSELSLPATQVLLAELANLYIEGKASEEACQALLSTFVATLAIRHEDGGTALVNALETGSLQLIARPGCLAVSGDTAPEAWTELHVAGVGGAAWSTRLAALICVFPEVLLELKMDMAMLSKPTFKSAPAVAAEERDLAWDLNDAKCVLFWVHLGGGGSVPVMGAATKTFCKSWGRLFESYLERSKYPPLAFLYLLNGKALDIAGMSENNRRRPKHDSWKDVTDWEREAYSTGMFRNVNHEVVAQDNVFVLLTLKKLEAQMRQSAEAFLLSIGVRWSLPERRPDRRPKLFVNAVKELVEEVREADWGEEIAVELKKLLFRDDGLLELSAPEILGATRANFVSKFPLKLQKDACKVFDWFVADDVCCVWQDIVPKRSLELCDDKGVMDLTKMVMPTSGSTCPQFSRRWSWDSLGRIDWHHFESVKHLVLVACNLESSDCVEVEKFLLLDRSRFLKLETVDLSDNVFSWDATLLGLLRAMRARGLFVRIDRSIHGVPVKVYSEDIKKLIAQDHGE